MTQVINLWAGPGAGKSTTAAGLFFEMKSEGYKCELVTEYAKELCYEDRLRLPNYNPVPTAQAMLDEQYRRQWRLKNKVDFIITDSPLLLSAIYSTDNNVIQSAHARFKEFDNINFYIRRVKPYAEYGRVQSEDEARELDKRIFQFLMDTKIWQHMVLGNKEAPIKLLNVLRNHHGHTSNSVPLKRLRKR